MTIDFEKPGPDDAEKADAARASRDQERLLEQMARRRASHGWRLGHMMVLVALVALACWMIAVIGFAAVVLLVLLGLALLCGSVFVFLRVRAARRDMLLGILSVAAERSMPLAPAIEAFADQFRGQSRGNVLAVAGRLRSGDRAPEALEAFPEAVPREAIVLAWVGEATGRLPEALHFAHKGRPARLSSWSAIASRLAYLLNVILIVQIVLGFLAYRIAPKFEAIFRDFSAPLPGVTAFLFRMTRWFVVMGPFAALIVLIEAAMFGLLPFTIVGWMAFHPPILGRLMDRRHTALILRALSLAVDANHPIEKALTTLREHYPRCRTRSRLVAADAAVQRGGDWIYALHDSGILRRSDAELLGSAASVGNLAWAMRELADTCERRQQLRFQAAIQTLLPVTVVMLGGLVGLVAIAYFLPLVSLIQRLTWP